MKRIGVLVAGAALTMVCSNPAFAQDRAKAGLMLGSGSEIGVDVPVGDNISLRPNLRFSRNKVDYDTATPADGTTTSWHPSLDVLFYVKSWDATRLYVSPQYTLSRATAKSGGNSATSTAHQANVMLGAKHTLGRFGVFAETGLGYWWTADSSPKNTSWTTRSAIGGLIFF